MKRSNDTIFMVRTNHLTDDSETFDVVFTDNSTHVVWHAESENQATEVCHKFNSVIAETIAP